MTEGVGQLLKIKEALCNSYDFSHLAGLSHEELKEFLRSKGGLRVHGECSLREEHDWSESWDFYSDELGLFSADFQRKGDGLTISCSGGVLDHPIKIVAS